MSRPPSKKPLGHPITDEKGNRTWEWHTNANIDTAVVRALGEDLSIESSNDRPQDCNPYDRSANKPLDGDMDKRRTLDDMRRLSETIRRAKHWPRAK
jgi:hypothetical protein